MSIFNAREMFEFAIRIEENGEKFYRKMAGKFDDKGVKELFINLANAEIEHKKIFQNMSSVLGDFNPPKEYKDDFYSYLDAYTSNLIFSFDNFEEEISKIEDLESAFSYAIDIEMNSILYYQEIKNLVTQDQHDIIEKIIDEERRHFITLSEKRKKLK
jgi:rubrerythrin